MSVEGESWETRHDYHRNRNFYYAWNKNTPRDPKGRRPTTLYRFLSILGTHSDLKHSGEVTLNAGESLNDVTIRAERNNRTNGPESGWREIETLERFEVFTAFYNAYEELLRLHHCHSNYYSTVWYLVRIIYFTST